MVYGRQVGDKELNFEASGALLEASLVMRDKETDSWWSIMTSDAIGGKLDGADLEELPGSTKTTWGEWRKLHPDTKVLSVDGVEHVENNPYDNYFNSDSTFRGLKVSDERLAPKAQIFAFHLGSNGETEAFAVDHQAIIGGALFRHPGFGDRVLLVTRDQGASFFASSDAFWVPAQEVPAGDRAQVVESLLKRAGRGEFQKVSGFDTFWYSWIAVNKDSRLLQAGG